MHVMEYNWECAKRLGRSCECVDEARIDHMETELFTIELRQLCFMKMNAWTKRKHAQNVHAYSNSSEIQSLTLSLKSVI